MVAPMLLVCNLLCAQSENIVITEIMYNPPESGSDSLEFIELYNASQNSINLADFKVSTAISTTLPNIELKAGKYFILAKDSVAIKNTFGVTADHKWKTGILGNSGEVIILSNANGIQIDSVKYDNSNPWPTAPNGRGSSLTLCDPTTNNSLYNNWSASTELVGSIANGSEVYASPGTASNCNILSFEELENNQNIEVYPNPTSGNVSVVLPVNYSTIKVEVYTPLGELVQTHNAINTNQVNFQLIGTTGVYLLQLTGDDSTIRKIKIVKQ